MVEKSVEALQVVINRRFIGGGFILADIAADNQAGLFFPETGHSGFHAIVIVAHAVDKRFIGWKTEQARLRIARLGQGGSGSHFDKSTTQRCKLDRKSTLLHSRHYYASHIP